MLAGNNSATEPALHRFQIVLKHSPVGIFQEIDSMIRRPGKQGSQWGLDHRNHYAVPILAAPPWRFAKYPRERLPKTAVRLETAVENRVVQSSAPANSHECPRETVAPAPGRKGHPIMLLKPSPRAFRSDSEIAKVRSFEPCSRRGFNPRNEFLSPLRRLSVCLQRMAAFARTITRKKAFLHRGEKFHVFKLRPRRARRLAKDSGRFHRHIKHAVISCVFPRKSALHFFPRRARIQPVIHLPANNFTHRSTEKATPHSCGILILDLHLARHDIGFHLKNNKEIVVEKFFARFDPGGLHLFFNQLSTAARAHQITV